VSSAKQVLLKCSAAARQQTRSLHRCKAEVGKGAVAVVPDPQPDHAPIPLAESILLTLSGRLTVSATGAQSLPPIPVLYDPFSRTFATAWFTLPRLLGGRTGAVTISISVAYPDAPTQSVSIPITLT